MPTRARRRPTRRACGDPWTSRCTRRHRTTGRRRARCIGSTSRRTGRSSPGSSPGSARGQAIGIGAAMAETNSASRRVLRRDAVRAVSREPTNTISPSFSLTTLDGMRVQLRHEAIEAVAASRTSLVRFGQRLDSPEGLFRIFSGFELSLAHMTPDAYRLIRQSTELDLATAHIDRAPHMAQR